jgi:DNA-directed RNA polymerase omega subunit
MSVKKIKIDAVEKLNNNGFTGVASEGTWPGIDSRFRLIIVAGLRTKQLLHGSTPRIEVDPKRHRNTSIALEEVKRGLVEFTRFNKDGSPFDVGADFKLNP